MVRRSSRLSSWVAPPSLGAGHCPFNRISIGFLWGSEKTQPISRASRLFTFFIHAEMRRYISQEPHCTFSRKIYLSFSVCSIVLLLSTLHTEQLCCKSSWGLDETIKKEIRTLSFQPWLVLNAKIVFLLVSQSALSWESATGRRAVDQGYNFKKAVQVQMKMVIWALLQIQSSFIYHHVSL